MATRKSKSARQLELPMSTWGGKRVGAGRKRRTPRPTVAHEVRDDVRAYQPVLVTMRLRDGLPTLRSRAAWARIVATFVRLRGRDGFQLVYYSVQKNHLHLIVECRDRMALATAMTVYTTRLAKALNQLFGRRGSLFDGRYHARSLTTPTETRYALRYVLSNARHHALDAGVCLPEGWLDPYSTASLFDGWTMPPCDARCVPDLGTSPPSSWMLRFGWRRSGGPIDPNEIPGPHDFAPRRARAT
jgi:REP element-mobilizing transposase RayT